MTRRTDIIDEDLHAFIDGELDEVSRHRMEEALAGDPDLSESVERYRADKARLAAVYGAGLEEPLPRRWIAMIEEQTERSDWRRMSWGLTALAASFILVLGMTIAVRQATPVAGADIVTQALAARGNFVQPRAFIAIRSAADVHSQDVAMTKALDTAAKAPDLSRMGYHLVGIQVYAAPQRSFELVYKDRTGQAFTLYLRRSAGEAARFDQFVQNGVRICVWQDDVVGMVMAGKMSAAEMQRLATLAYSGLTA
jgi:anti-sigma factor RsiW